MSYTQQAILRDKNGDAIPQIWDVTQNKFVPYTNDDIKLLQNELTLVKSELQTIKTNQLSGNQKVSLSGNIMEHYGATVAQRPEATEVPVGAAYMAVNTGDVWQSNGFEWVVL